MRRSAAPREEALVLPDYEQTHTFTGRCGEHLSPSIRHNEGGFMATRDTTTDDRRTAASRLNVTQREETKPSFLTTEFYAMIGVIAAILIAAAQADNFDAPRAWTLVAAVAIGYMVSRGLAKSGSDYRDRDRGGDRS
jgi:hypothetical protein